MVVNVSELANYLLYLDKENAKRDGEDATPDMTPLKIQKLLYYCQGYSLGLYGKPLFADTIEAWEHGPVVVSIYNRFRPLGRACIPFEEIGEPQIEERAKKIARFVMRDKGRFAAWALWDMTHNEKPWVCTYNQTGRKSIIKKDIIQEFFTSLFEEELSPDEEEAMFLNAGVRPTQKEWNDINKYVSNL